MGGSIKELGWMTKSKGMEFSRELIFMKDIGSKENTMVEAT